MVWFLDNFDGVFILGEVLTTTKDASVFSLADDTLRIVKIVDAYEDYSTLNHIFHSLGFLWSQTLTNLSPSLWR